MNSQISYSHYLWLDHLAHMMKHQVWWVASCLPVSLQVSLKLYWIYPHTYVGVRSVEMSSSTWSGTHRTPTFTPLAYNAGMTAGLHQQVYHPNALWPAHSLNDLISDHCTYQRERAALEACVCVRVSEWEPKRSRVCVCAAKCVCARCAENRERERVSTRLLAGPSPANCVGIVY